MSFTNGTYRILYFQIDGVYLPVGCLTSNSLSESADTIDSTVRGVRDGWTTQRVTQQSYSIDFDGLVGKEDDNTLISYDKLQELKRRRSLILWKIENTQGDLLTSYGQAQIIDLAEAADVDEFISFSCSMVGFGSLNDPFDNAYYQYIDRVVENGGQLASDSCIRAYVEKVTQGLYDKMGLGFNGGAGYTDGILFSLKPIDGSGDFYVTRNGTAIRRGESGIITEESIDVPRADFFEGRSCPAWLFEPESTNLILNSEPTGTEGADQNIAYEEFTWGNGFENAVFFGDNSVTRSRYAGTVLMNTEYTISVYVIMEDEQEPKVGDSNTDDFALAIAGQSATVNQIVSQGNGIYRVSGTRTAGTINLTTNGISKSVLSSDKTFRVVGWQLEQKGYPTSYKKTTGSTQIRFKDEVESDIITGLPSEEGVFFLQSKALGNVNDEWRVTISDGTEDNQVCLRYLNGGISCFITVAGAEQSTFSTQIIDINQFRNIAFGWQENNFEFRVDGDLIGSIDTSGSSFNANTLDRVRFSDATTDTYRWYGWVGELSIYNDRSIDLEDLTAYDTFAEMANNFGFELK